MILTLVTGSDHQPNRNPTGTLPIPEATPDLTHTPTRAVTLMNHPNTWFTMSFRLPPTFIPWTPSSNPSQTTF